MDALNVYTQDPPPAAVPDSARYEKAVMLRYDAYLAALSLKKAYRNAAFVCLIPLAVMLIDDVQVRHDLKDIAKYKASYIVERGFDGHQRTVAMTEIVGRPEAARRQDVQWFATWLSRVAIDPQDRGMARDRMAARNRLVGGMEVKW